MLQILINGVISGLLLALVALGFHVIFKATNIFHMAHGGIYVAGAYFFYWLNPLIGLIPGLVCSFLFAFILGITTEWIVYKPLRTKSNNQNIALISSLGVYIILVNIIALLSGNETKILNNNLSESISYGDLIITRPQLYQVLFSIPVILLFIYFLRYTGLGLKIRAVANNSVLASVVGIKIQRVRYLVFGLGSLIAVCAAILKGYDTGLDPNSGMTIMLSAAVVVIVGGNYSLTGTVVASLLLSIVQNYTEYFLSAQWKEPVTFAILILMLLWRTEGILQFNTRTDEQ